VVWWREEAGRDLFVAAMMNWIVFNQSFVAESKFLNIFCLVHQKSLSKDKNL
jgi:hypothetical protein